MWKCSSGGTCRFAGATTGCRASRPGLAVPWRDTQASPLSVWGSGSPGTGGRSSGDGSAADAAVGGASAGAAAGSHRVSSRAGWAISGGAASGWHRGNHAFHGHASAAAAAAAAVATRPSRQPFAGPSPPERVGDQLGAWAGAFRGGRKDWPGQQAVHCSLRTLHARRDGGSGRLQPVSAVCRSVPTPSYPLPKFWRIPSMPSHAPLYYSHPPTHSPPVPMHSTHSHPSFPHLTCRRSWCSRCVPPQT